MAHAPGVGYSAQRPAKAKTAPPAKTAAPVTAAPATKSEPAPDAPSAIPTPAAAWSGLSVPGKAVLVGGLVILGLGLQARLTGKPFTLGFGGFSSPTPLLASGTQQPAATVASLPLSATIASRTAKANPAKVGA